MFPWNVRGFLHLNGTQANAENTTYRFRSSVELNEQIGFVTPTLVVTLYCITTRINCNNYLVLNEDNYNIYGLCRRTIFRPKRKLKIAHRTES
jgi:hypothetical protein